MVVDGQCVAESRSRPPAEHEELVAREAPDLEMRLNGAIFASNHVMVFESSMCTLSPPPIPPKISKAPLGSAAAAWRWRAEGCTPEHWALDHCILLESITHKSLVLDGWLRRSRAEPPKM